MKHFIVLAAILVVSVTAFGQQITSQNAFDNAGPGSWFEVYTQSQPGNYFDNHYLNMKVESCPSPINKIKIDFWTPDKSTKLDWFYDVALQLFTDFPEDITFNQMASLVQVIRDASCGNSDYKGDVQNYINQYLNACWQVACIEE